MAKKMWLVKREVMANSIEEAIKGKGRVYEVQEADYTEPEKKEVGFSNKRKK